MTIATKRPNFLICLADDLGYSDIGCFASEIKTPVIDKLAAEGLRMTDFHATAACSPTRAILLSGTDNHIAGVGCMSEMKGAGGERWNVKGHEGYLNDDVVALPELLQEAGYHTLMSGKWHLGLKPEHNPAARGFDRSMALLPGCSNHYGFEPQFGQDYLSFFERIPPLYSRDGVKMDVECNSTQAPEGFYSSDYYCDNLIDYLRDWKDQSSSSRSSSPASANDIDGRPAQSPFFAYLPFSAPHWPLQCSKEDADLYKGVYDDGPDALRKRRLQALIDAGIHKPDVVPAEVIADHVPEWEEMNAEEKRLSARAMEVYAGMVTAMDRALGRVIDYLEDIDELDNTFVIFMSDNGAEGAAYEAIPVMGKTLMKVIDRYYDNSYENIGNHDSFTWVGPRWAQAATAPHRLHKMYSTEGGIRVPFVIRYPPMTSTFNSGSLIRPFATVADITPTILDLAKVTHPVPQGQAVGEWRNRPVAGLRGKSWLPYFDAGVDGSDKIHGDTDPAFGWELFGRAALRQGRWKILHVGPAAGGREDGKWQLYDVVADPGETNDLSEVETEVYQSLLAQWEVYVAETGTVWGEALPPVGYGGSGQTPTDMIGGDPLEQTRAWMQISKGQAPVYKDGVAILATVA